MKRMHLLFLTGLFMCGTILGAQENDTSWILPKFGEKLLTSAGQEVDAASTLAGKTVGVYFSASWCGPCRGFTPQLVKFHKQTGCSWKRTAERNPSGSIIQVRWSRR